MKIRLTPFLISAVVFLLDRITKAIIKGRISLWDEHVVIPRFFSIVHTENRGAAFSMFADASAGFRTVFLIALSLAVMVFITTLLVRPLRGGSVSSPLLRAGLGLILGGAAGNVWDRILNGSVTDFLQFYFGSYQFAAFNVADSAITIGAGLLLLDMWLARHKHQEAQVPSGERGL